MNPYEHASSAVGRIGLPFDHPTLGRIEPRKGPVYAIGSLNLGKVDGFEIALAKSENRIEVVDRGFVFFDRAATDNEMLVAFHDPWQVAAWELIARCWNSVRR